jgi:acetate kinase
VRVLVVNAGSSSLKLGVVHPGDALLAAPVLPAPGGPTPGRELAAVLRDLGTVDAVGHRIVHGGDRFVEPIRVDDDVVAALHALTDLAPLHQAKSLAALEAVTEALPEVPAVACFDTAFHAALPAAAATYALPASLRDRFRVRRYGFHGLSHAYASRRAAELCGVDDLRVVTCHLGAGASLAAVRGGRSLDTTMGFTPLEGLVMATRSGSVDPGLVLWLIEHGGMSPRELTHALEHESGLLGLAGTPDMRALLSRADADAGLALDVYVHRLRAGIGAMAAAMDGLDALVFTGGVGENAPEIRARTVAGLGFLGLALDGARNAAARGDQDVSPDGAGARVLVLAAREDLEIARQVRTVLAAPPRPLAY